MGQSNSQTIKALFNVGSENEFQVKTTMFLTQDYIPILPIEARQIIKHDRFPQLFALLIQRMLYEENNKVIVNTLLHLTTFIPIMLAEQNPLLIKNNPKAEVEIINRLTVIKVDEDVEPLEATNLAQAHIFHIIENLCQLLFKPGFTIQGVDTFNIDNDPRLKSLLQELLNKNIKIKLQNIWRGLARITKYPNDQSQYYQNRVYVLSCLLACLQEQLYHADTIHSALTYLAYEDHVEMFTSMWAVILFHKHGYFWFQDNILIQQKKCRKMAILSAQILSIVFSFDQELNHFRKIVIETKLLDYSFDLLIENLSQSLISDSKLITTKIHNNDGVQEFLGLLYFLITKNIYAKEYLKQLTQTQMKNIFNVLLYYLAQYLDKEINHQVYSIILEFIDYLLQFENIIKFTEEEMIIQFKIKQFPLNHGTYQDIIISYYSYLLLLDFKSRTQYFIEHYKKKNQDHSIQYIVNYKPTIICQSIFRLSSNSKKLNIETSKIFSQLIEKYFYYEFIFMDQMQAQQQEFLCSATLNLIRNQNPNILMQISLISDIILKFKVTNGKQLKFFKYLDEKETGLQDKDIDQQEQLQRFQNYLQQWRLARQKFEGNHITQLKQLLTVILNELESNRKHLHLISEEEFECLYNKLSWTFINEISLPCYESTFSLEKYSYSLLNQQLDYMPLIDLEKVVYL